MTIMNEFDDEGIVVLEKYLNDPHWIGKVERLKSGFQQFHYSVFLLTRGHGSNANREGFHSFSGQLFL